MKILYFTTALYEEDYNILLKRGVIAGEAKSQTFNHLLIETLCLNNDVAIVSLPRISSTKIRIFGSHGYHYVEPMNGLYGRLTETHELLRIARNLDFVPDIVAFDPMDIHVGDAAITYSLKTGLPSFTWIVDDLSKTLKKNSRSLNKAIKNISDATACLVLNQSSPDKKEKPIYRLVGLVEDKIVEPHKAARPYFFAECPNVPASKINALLTAYHAAGPNYDLFVSTSEDRKNEERLRFVGRLSREESIAYQKGASLIIDLESAKQWAHNIKITEYLSSGSPLLTTDGDASIEAYRDSVNCLSDGSKEALSAFFETHLDEKRQLKDIKTNKAAESVCASCSVTLQSLKLQEFLKAILNS